jgi:hypothetical protein
MSEPVIVPFDSKRRAKALAAQHIQHAIPAFGLAIVGGSALLNGAEGFELVLAVAEVLTSTALVIAVARHLRHAGRPSHHHRIDWVTFIAAAMLFTEAGEKWHRTGRLFTPQMSTAVATVVTALGYSRIAARRERRRMLHISDAGIEIRRGPLRRRFSAAWHEITSIDVGDREALIHTTSGTRGRIDLGDLHNAAHVATALREAQARVPAVASQ